MRRCPHGRRRAAVILRGAAQVLLCGCLFAQLAETAPAKRLLDSFSQFVRFAKKAAGSRLFRSFTFVVHVIVRCKAAGRRRIVTSVARMQRSGIRVMGQPVSSCCAALHTDYHAGKVRLPRPAWPAVERRGVMRLEAALFKPAPSMPHAPVRRNGFAPTPGKCPAAPREPGVPVPYYSRCR